MWCILTRADLPATPTARTGWAIRGRLIFGWISGKHHGRTNLIMAQRGADWLAPMLFETNCTHVTVTTWIEKMLLPALRPNRLCSWPG
jgi:hypothetical protein